MTTIEPLALVRASDREPPIHLTGHASREAVALGDAVHALHLDAERRA